MVAAAVTFLVLAHGAPPQVYTVVEHPTDPSHLIAGTTFGLLLSDDDGGSWQWVCEEAIGSGATLQTAWWIAPSGALLGGTFRGLFTSVDHGCTWTSHPDFGPTPDGGQGPGVADLHSNGTTLFAVSGKFGITNRVWASTNAGVDWSPTPVSSDTEFYTTVRSAPSRPQRVYVAAWWFRPVDTEALYVSDDNGASFSRLDVTTQMPMVRIADGGTDLARGALYIYAIDPTDPDVIWAGLSQGEEPYHSFVLKSSDQGVTWQLQLDTGAQLNSLAMDTGRVWAGTGIKVYESTNAGATFTPLEHPTSQGCAARQGDRFYACGWYEVDGFALARRTNGELENLITWPRVTGVETCYASSKVASICAGFFPGVQAAFPILGGAGGGAGGGSGAGGGGGIGPPNPVPCHCSTQGAEVSLTVWLLLSRLSAAHALRRRRVHR